LGMKIYHLATLIQSENILGEKWFFFMTDLLRKKI
jgi:hypothetical protein